MPSAAPASELRAKTPALVLTAPVHTAPGVIRALARDGIPQFTIGVGTSYVSYSRWYRRLPDHGGEEPTPETLAGFLERLSVERMVLIPCSDAWVAAAGSLTPALAARFPASLASKESLDACLDKGRFAEMLAGLGLPHPRTICVGPADDVSRLWDAPLRDPFLKPRLSLAFQERFGIKAFRFRTREEAMARIREAQEAGLELMLQEYIPGPASSHYYVDGFVDRAGSVCARFARRRVRTYPEPFGYSSCMVSIPLEEARAPLSILDRLLSALRYRGIFSAEFKHDDRDGQIKFLELNARPWGGVSLPVRCGVNVVTMAYRDALGLPVEPVRDYPSGRHWVYPARDRIVCWRLFREGRLTPAAWLRSWVGAVQPIFCWDDPAPALADFSHRLRQSVRRRLGLAAAVSRGPR